MNTQFATWWPWIETLGWTLLHFLWQGLVIGAGFAVLRALLPKTHCDARYATGLVALALLALCPPLTFMVLHHQQVVAAAVGQASPAIDAGQLALGRVAASPALSAGLERLLPWLVLLWGAGVMLVACRTWHQWRGLNLVAHRFAAPDAGLDAALARVVDRLRFVQRIRVLVSSHIDTPTLIGWLRPVILLPTAVALGFPVDQIELILAHEVSHLRRHDHLVNLVQTLVETLLFYHPVVHWISRDVRNERELCCDRLVLRLTAGEPRRYARALTALEELRLPPAQLALAANGGLLLDRIRRIVGMPTPQLSVGRQIPAQWLLMAVGLSIALAVTLRIEQFDTVALRVSRLTVDWWPAAELRVLPSVALVVPFERPRLELAPIRRARADAAPAVGTSTPARQRELAYATPPSLLEARISPPVFGPEPAHGLIATHDLPVVTDLRPAKPLLAVASDAVLAKSEASATPVPIHRVAPDYPFAARGDETERVKFRFAIAADGSVRDIAVVGNTTDAAFARAAEHALVQWRFSHVASADPAKRYLQTFVFRPAGARVADANCINSTGSHICRRPDGMPIFAEGAAATADPKLPVRNLQGGNR
jgi:bla regulator protein BlaR1